MCDPGVKPEVVAEPSEDEAMFSASIPDMSHITMTETEMKPNNGIGISISTSTSTSTTVSTGPMKESGGIPNHAVPMMIDTSTGRGSNLRNDAKVITQSRLSRLKELSNKPEDELSIDQRNEKRRIIRLEKNRRAAAMSRRKKKMYIRNLEERAALMAKHLAILEMENNQLRGLLAQVTTQLQQLQHQQMSSLIPSNMPGLSETQEMSEGRMIEDPSVVMGMAGMYDENTAMGHENPMGTSNATSNSGSDLETMSPSQNFMTGNTTTNTTTSTSSQAGAPNGMPHDLNNTANNSVSPMDISTSISSSQPPPLIPLVPPNFGMPPMRMMMGLPGNGMFPGAPHPSFMVPPHPPVPTNATRGTAGHIPPNITWNEPKMNSNATETENPQSMETFDPENDFNETDAPEIPHSIPGDDTISAFDEFSIKGTNFN